MRMIHSRGYQAASFALAGRAVATASGRRSLKMADFIYEYGLVMKIVGFDGNWLITRCHSEN